MAYIPQGAHWFVAELLLEITVQGDTRNVLHSNLTLIHAASPDEAYDKAIQLGRDAQAEYPNPASKNVRTVFRGISQLNVIYDRLEHGAELLFNERLGVSEEEIERLIPSKQSLAVFKPIEPTRGPDYSSREILEGASHLIRDRQKRHH